MGFGAIIASGEKNQLLRDDLVDCITEVRVEQSLDDPTRFAIRFQDDISEGQPRIRTAPELACGQMITIAVKVAGDTTCLVRGPITDVKSSFVLGGPGSWHEIRGEDRRIELDRQSVQRRWSGKASEAARTILGKTFETGIQGTSITYGSRRAQGREVLQTLNQRDTDACFIAGIARDNNLHFWIEYECRAVGDSLIVRETANLKSSPPRPDGATTDRAASAVKLAPTVAVTLRVNVATERCPNVSGFHLTMDFERPNRFFGTAIDDGAVRPHPTSVTDRQPTIQKGGRRFGGCDKPRDAAIVTAGNQDELQAKAESSATAEGWFVAATVNTTAHMLGGVLLAHDVVEVEGLEPPHGGPYHVKAVTHVINAADHFMDLELRGNAVGGD